jgi:hypothetical protein
MEALNFLELLQKKERELIEEERRVKEEMEL